MYFNLCSITLPFSLGNGFLMACDLLHNSSGKFLKMQRGFNARQKVVVILKNKKHLYLLLECSDL